MISGLHHYALEVPDLEVADAFLQDFGLETGEKAGPWSPSAPAATRSRSGSCGHAPSGCTMSPSRSARARWTRFARRWSGAGRQSHSSTTANPPSDHARRRAP